jgi:hypothetical protein
MDERAYREFAAWLRRVARSSPPPEGIAAYNFGLFESEGGYVAYLTGSREYDPEDDDWACREDYTPAERYVDLRGAFDEGATWREVQHGVVGMIKRFVESPEFSDSFLSGASAVTVGFDDGDLERVA